MKLGVACYYSTDPLTNDSRLQTNINRPAGRFRWQVTDWQATLGEVETFLKLMLSVQRQWTSLEAIFLTSKDIRAQLPDDTRRSVP